MDRPTRSPAASPCRLWVQELTASAVLRAWVSDDHEPTPDLHRMGGRHDDSYSAGDLANPVLSGWEHTGVFGRSHGHPLRRSSPVRGSRDHSEPVVDDVGLGAVRSPRRSGSHLHPSLDFSCRVHRVHVWAQGLGSSSDGTEHAFKFRHPHERARSSAVVSYRAVDGTTESAHGAALQSAHLCAGGISGAVNGGDYQGNHRRRQQQNRCVQQN